MINSRMLYDELNVFHGVGRGGLFLGLLTTIVLSQLVIVQALAPVFKITPQTPLQWLIAVALGAGSLLVSLVVKLLSRQSIVAALAGWGVQGTRAVLDRVASFAMGLAAKLGMRRMGGSWSRLEAAGGNAEAHVAAKGTAATLPLSHGSQEGRPMAGSPRTLTQSPSRQWGCWSTLAGASGSGTFSRQASSLSRHGSNVVAVELAAVEGRGAV